MEKCGLNDTKKRILLHSLTAALSLFANGFGIYLTIQADIGVSPWDVLNIGLSKTIGIHYGTASVLVSLTILLLDIILREPIGIGMFIDAIVVGKSVDLFTCLKIVPKLSNIFLSIGTMFLGLIIIGFTQYTYMKSALGCGPRDTLMVGLKKRANKIPIGLVSVMMLSVVTFIGWLLGGPVGIGTIICAFLAGPIMQLIFHFVHFEASSIQHQNLLQSFHILFSK